MSTDLEHSIFPMVIADAIRPYTGSINNVVPVGGGCIANATRLLGTKGTFFIKWGDSHISRTFEAEAKGLQVLHDADSPLVIPEVITYESGDHGYILLEWLHQGHASPQSWQAFGRGLAGLHRHAQKHYGLDENNFIGRSLQINESRDSWPHFFRASRLDPQVHMAREAGKWLSTWDVWLDGLYNRLDSLIPTHPTASLVHGDLWGGNFMTLNSGQIALIDPAVYFGHREVDLAMTELFGGFKKEFYEAYWEEWPVEEGYSERKDLYNLYHLLNHLNLFGGSYQRGVEKVLKRFGG